MSGLVKILLVAGGTFFVAVGVLALFLPLLPTTPFLLLAAACYARSSDRLYHWLLTNRWFGEYITNYRQGRGMSRKHKVIAIVLLWLAIGYAAGFAVSLWWVNLLLVCIAVGVTVYLIKMKTFEPELGAIPPEQYACGDNG